MVWGEEYRRISAPKRSLSFVLLIPPSLFLLFQVEYVCVYVKPELTILPCRKSIAEMIMQVYICNYLIIQEIKRSFCCC